jgi:hypothetical protein
VPTPIEPRVRERPPAAPFRPRRATVVLAALSLLANAGCGEPSLRELENRRELEALLTAIALKNVQELDKDIKRIDVRHTAGDLTDKSYDDLQTIAKKAKAGDWAGAEKQAYALRESTPFFR